MADVLLKFIGAAFRITRVKNVSEDAPPDVRPTV